MAINFKKIWQGLGIVPKTSSTSDSKGELEVIDSTGKLNYHNGTSNSPIVTEAHTATLTNKTIDADDNTISDLEVDNLKAGVLNVSTTLTGASDLQVPSALAVKTYADNSSGAVQADVDDLITLSGVAANSTDLGTFTGAIIPDASDVKEALQALETFAETDATNLSNHISDATDAHDASAISNVPAGTIAATDVQAAINELDGDIQNKVTGPASATDNAIVRYDATTGKLVQNSGVIISDLNGISGVVDLSASGAIDSASSLITDQVAWSESNDTATGSNATLTAPASPEIRLTNSSLVSLDMIPAGVSGQIITLTNATGNAITINDNTGGTAANRVLTGTKAALTLSDEASVVLKYDGTESRWMIIGGSGAGGGSSLDTVFQLDATEQLTQWSTGNNASFLGGGSIAGTFVKETASPLSGLASYKYTQAGGSLNDYIASPAQSVSPIFRGRLVTILVPYLYDGAASDIALVAYDATNATQLTVNSLSLISAPTATGVTSTYRMSVLIPASCASIRVGFQVVALNSGKILQFDNVVMTSNNLTSLNLVQTQNSILSQTASFGNADITGALSTSTGSGLYTYNSGTGVYTALKPIKFTINATFRAGGAASVQPLITDSAGAIEYAAQTSIATTGARAVAAATISLAAGSTVKARNATANTTNEQYIYVYAEAQNPNIVSATDTFSSDTAPFVYAGSSSYTLSTLANAPIGTFITFTYASSSNTITQTNAAAPTQTTSDMSTNGIRIYARAFNAASTSANPAAVAIQIGKGMKAASLNLFAATGKSNSGSMDLCTNNGSTQFGFRGKEYNEVTGILYLDAGSALTGSITTSTFQFADGTQQSNGYVVINASKSPALVGIPEVQPRLAIIQDVKSSGTVGGAATSGAWTTHTLNTITDTSTIVTSLSSNQFVLPAGTYYVSADAQFFRTNECKIRLQNITDGTTQIVGESGYADASAGQHSPTLFGQFTITSSKTYELQWRVGTTKTINGLGVASGFGVDEIYATVVVQRIR